MRGEWRSVGAVARTTAMVIAAAALLSGCGLFDDEEILEGERIRLRSESSAAPSNFGGAALPQPREIRDWTQTNGSASHNSGHLAGPASLAVAWSRDIGAGSSSESAITSAPIVVGGVVYAMDAAAEVSALDAASGTEKWRVDLSPEGESGREGFGGGLAASGGRIFAATGFGEVVSLDPASGEIAWRTPLGAPVRAAPAAEAGLVVAVTRDNRAFGLDAETGTPVWRVPSVTSDAGVLGGASPSLAGGLAFLPFASGELIAIEARSGRRLWSAVLSGGRRGLARAAISDVTGDPVVVGPYVIAANQAGRMVAIDARSGQRAWTRSVGAQGPIWAAGDTVFVTTDDSKLMRISARDGTTIWETELQAFDDPEDREDPISYSGPVLVEGRLLITSSEGELIAFDGVGGEELSRIDLAGGSITGPVVSGDTIFVLTDRGTVQALR
ncbi:PQQ-binding-like beta-propeller repeat protein [Limibaculum sp. M0105]|uniref:PQQ-binding-like beta-propeller repeat protein n=1 Tax=Thermohalobaculum xanthum TaxID=2753746 RepID=A0A8J7SED1_9RHOB|nr:PQQ-binding-like beta-propeller repeat protein [Thermohalobaculum xanthum]MBK0397820.1 PQQ-binding-like beta-propeller repeat protein [Thermohalobaculum xanthum]